MSEIQLFFWGINAAIIFVVLFVILIIALWVVNKWILKGKIRLLYRILISIGIPLILIGWDYYSTNSSFYSSSNMDKLLDGIGAGITLPLYEITSYKNEHVMADDFKDTYQMIFKDANIKSMISTLDSVCSANENWEKRGDEYIFNSLNYEKEFNDSLIIRPNKGTATFVRYMW